MDALRVNFDNKLRFEFYGTRITSNAGLLAYRELDQALGLTVLAKDKLTDVRTGKNTRHSLTALLRQSVFSRLAGYEDTNDAERMCVDPAMRHVVGGRAKDATAASASQMSRFETEVLTQPDNLEALMTMPGQWVDRVRQRRSFKKLILDMDSSVSETHGHQVGSVFDGYFGCKYYHPLFVFNQDGDVEAALLRSGNIHDAADWRSILEPVIERCREAQVPKYFRGDAVFAIPGLYELLEAEGCGYSIRLKGNAILMKHIEHLLIRPVGRPPKKPVVLYNSFEYQAQNWGKPRRVVAKVQWHHGPGAPGFQLAEVAVMRDLFRQILDRIRRFAAIPPRAAPI